MLVLRTSNFQGATIRPMVPRDKHSIVFIVIYYLVFIDSPILIGLNCSRDAIVLAGGHYQPIVCIRSKCPDG